VALDCSGHTCVIEGGGEVKCWGDNYNGQLGISRSSLDMRPSPMQVPGTMMHVHIARGRVRARLPCCAAAGAAESLPDEDRIQSPCLSLPLLPSFDV
jgi:hypothetical protein